MGLYIITKGVLGNLFIGKLEVKEKAKTYKVIKGCMYFHKKKINKNEIDVFYDDVVLSFNKDKGIEIFKKGLIEKKNILEEEYKSKKNKIEILLENIDEISNR